MTKNFSLDEQLKKARNFINKGNYKNAKECYELIVSKFPKNVRALEGIEEINQKISNTDNILSNSITQLINFYNQQKYEKGIILGEKLIKKYPRQAIIPNILGATFSALDKNQKSIEHYKLALEIDPNNAQVYNNLGITYKKVGKFNQAIEILKKSIKIKPDFAEAYNNLALSFKEKNYLDETVNYLKKAIVINPNYIEALYNLGNTYTSIGNLNEAIEMYKKAIQINPNYFDALNNMGATFNLCKDYKSAYSCISKAIKIRPNVADAHNNLGTAELNLEKESKAIESYEKAIEIDPMYAMAYSNLCSLYERNNNLGKIEETLKKAEKNSLSNNEDIKFRKAQLYSRKKDYINSIAILEKIDDLKISNKMRIDKYELLGKDYDKSNNYQNAFKCFQKSNSLVKLSAETNLFRPKNYQNEVKELIASYSKIKKIKWDNKIETKSLKSPVFLVGFPRSGTTLLDNILSSHPNICSLEEKPMIAKVKQALGQTCTYENLNKLSEVEIQKMREVYLKELSNYLSDKSIYGKVFIDKLPLSIIDIGLILRIFPNSKFILATRHPLDCILSCFMQTFNINDAMANFLDLKDTANLYNRSMKLFDIYNNAFNLKFHLIKYENLISSLKAETTKLLNFLDLKWENEIINYRENALEKTIKTPSYNQVTEKIYTRASGRWKNYKNEIKDIIPIVQFWIDKWEY